MIVDKFLGLVNKVVEQRTPLGALSVADNIDIDDANNVHLRRGFTHSLLLADVSAAYSADNEIDCFFIESGDLYRLNADLSYTLIASGVTQSTNEVYFNQMGDTIYFTGGASGVIRNGGYTELGISPPMYANAVGGGSGELPVGQYMATVTYLAPDGRESGASFPAKVHLAGDSSIIVSSPDKSGYTKNIYISSVNTATLYYAGNVASGSFTFAGPLLQLTYPLSDTQIGGTPPPTTDGISCIHKNRLYISQYLPYLGQTAIWISEAFWPELFKNDNFVMIPDEVVGMFNSSQEGSIIIGTRSRIYSYADGNLETLADYGLVPGQPVAYDDKGRAFFWTADGFCTAMPFENLTREQLSLPEGSYCFGAVIEDRGYEKYVAYIKEGGSADNPYS